jgi:nucleoside-diphosphate-sugar epimerase
MKVFVAGGTGALGTRLIPKLRSAGHEVFATTRSPQKADEIGRLGAKGVVMDGLDQESVLAAVEEARPEAIVHEMTALAELEGQSDMRHFDRSFAMTNRLRSEGTDNLLAAAARVGTRRFVVQSYAAWPYARTGGSVKSEEDPLDPDPPAEQRESLRAIEHLERAVRDAPLEGLALRYGAFYGPGTSESVFGELARKRRLPVVGGGGGIWSFVHIDDAAAATAIAVERGAPGIYNVVDDEPAPSAEWIRALAQQVGAKPPRHVPRWLGRLAAGEVGVSMMCEIRGASNEKAKRELGWQPAHSTWRGVLGTVASAA